ncbi:MAG: acyl-CoA thioesterase [Lachnospiraceae bacterium]|nr:acyl-CoA thioesterase [Lachnospiraceae bacterium]
MLQRTVSYSKSEQVHIVQPADLNAGGRLFGGTLLKMIDELAAVVAMRHAGTKTVTTAAIDNLVFKAGAFLGDMIVLIGYVTHTGRTSMEVRVDTYVEKDNGFRYPINRAYMVMVAIDSNNCPTPVPPIILENEFQEEEFRMAQKRRELRLERNKGGF